MNHLSFSVATMAIGLGRRRPADPSPAAVDKLHAGLGGPFAEVYAGMGSGLVETHPSHVAFRSSTGRELRGLHLAATDGEESALQTSNAFLVGRVAILGADGAGAAALAELVKRANLRRRGASMQERRLYLEAFAILAALCDRDPRFRAKLEAMGFDAPARAGMYSPASDNALKAQAFAVGRDPYPMREYSPDPIGRPFTLDRTVEQIRKRIGLTRYLERAAKKKESKQ